MQNKTKPRIALLCDKKGWAFDTTAQHLSQHLANKYLFKLFYVDEHKNIDPDEYDLIYVFWWGEKFHRKFIWEPTKIVKEISSHRWEIEPQFGLLSPRGAYERFMYDAGYLVATSKRLLHAFQPVFPNVFHYPLGINERLYKPNIQRNGNIKFGWAGNPEDKIKGLHDIIKPACANIIDLSIATGNLSYTSMPEFYNSIDVIFIASIAEGTPLPLIEGMACGCFPIITDVGVASEIIEHGKNGLIVNRTVDSFRIAIEWCKQNPTLVRKAGLYNSELIRSTRTWKNSAEHFDKILEEILDMRMNSENKNEPSSMIGNSEYEKHFSRINQSTDSESAYKSAHKYIIEDVEPLLPKSKDICIIEVGTGYGHFLKYLADNKYSRIWGIDISEALMNNVRSNLGHRVERLEVADARSFFPEHKDSFDVITILDMIEHVTLPDAKELLVEARKALKPGGRIILRTPNMANILGNYSLYMDITHRHGYTEWSLIHLLEECGFTDAKVHIPWHADWKRKLYMKINTLLHKFLYTINDRAAPRWYGKNIVIWAIA